MTERPEITYEHIGMLLDYDFVQWRALEILFTNMLQNKPVKDEMRKMGHEPTVLYDLVAEESDDVDSD